MKKMWQMVLAILGIQEFAQDADKKYSLTAEQRAKLVEMLGEDFAKEFEAKMNDPDPVAGSSAAPAPAAAPPATPPAPAAGPDSVMARTMAQMALDHQREMATMQQQIAGLLNKPQDDPPAGGGAATAATDSAWIAEGKYLFGVKNELFAIGPNRPWNQAAYAALAAQEGYVITLPKAGSVDYTQLKSDLGSYYRQRRQDAIVSYVTTLPSLDSIFPREYGYQDQAVLPQLFPSELSQPHQDTFTPKGSFTIDPETLSMWDVKFDHKFANLKEIEKVWIGYLNKEKSNAMKWSFIEFLLMEAAKILSNEYNLRKVGGVGIPAISSVATSFLHGSDGVLKFIEKKIANFQIKPFDIGDYSASTIVSHVKTATGMIPRHLLDTGAFKCYMSMNTYMMYKEHYKTLYGTYTDYDGPTKWVDGYENLVEIVPVPGAFRRIWWTFAGNIRQFEMAPGEMTMFDLEQEDRTLKAWSNWKESVWAFMVGKKFASAAAQTYEQQMIFTTTVEDVYTYISVPADTATPSVAYHNCLVVANNTTATAITDFVGSGGSSATIAVGTIIRVKCGSSTNKVSIAASGNFVLASAWSPNLGDEIILMTRSDKKFVEIGRIDSSTGALYFTADDTTPSVKDGSIFYLPANTQATAITNLDDAVVGKTYTLIGTSATNASTIANSGNFVLTAAMTLNATGWIKLRKSASNGKFYEIERNS
jgi:hypothetical protein